MYVYLVSYYKYYVPFMREKSRRIRHISLFLPAKQYQIQSRSKPTGPDMNVYGNKLGIRCEQMEYGITILQIGGSCSPPFSPWSICLYLTQSNKKTNNIPKSVKQENKQQAEINEISIYIPRLSHLCFQTTCCNTLTKLPDTSKLM